MSLILNQAQAEAAYSAMCALSNAGVTRFSGVIPGKDANGGTISTEVVRNCMGGVILETAGRVYQDYREVYADLNSFATAYGLISDEPQSAVAAAAGGLTQTAIER